MDTAGAYCGLLQVTIAAAMVALAVLLPGRIFWFRQAIAALGFPPLILHG